ncbi:MAG: hypothetical protein P8P83_05890, partial [Rickettsiaceae bacterium]|nr:hypothetical protein [Rickettsiaceae bacterium]
MKKRKHSDEFADRSAPSVDQTIARPQEAQINDTLQLEGQYSSNPLSNALFESVKNWDIKAVKGFLARGVNINITYTDGADNSTGNSLIMLAVATYKIVPKEKKKNIHNIDLIELLIDHGCDIYAQNSQGKTVIDLVKSLPNYNPCKRISKEQAYVESKAKYDSLKDSAKKEEINKNLIEILQKKPDNY